MPRPNSHCQPGYTNFKKIRLSWIVNHVSIHERLVTILTTVQLAIHLDNGLESAELAEPMRLSLVFPPETRQL
jgi:hypothetical protein